MSTAVLALLAAVAAIVATGVDGGDRAFASDGRRTDASPPGSSRSAARMDALARELGLTVERVREDALRARLVESLGQALDLDEVLARCAEAAASLHGVAGAIADDRGRRRDSSWPPTGLDADALKPQAGGRRPTRRQHGARRRDLVPLSAGHDGRDGLAVGDRGAARVRGSAPRLPDRVRARARSLRSRATTSRRSRRSRATRSLRSRRRGTRGAPRHVPRHRPAHRPRQPPGAPRDTRARGRPGASPRPQARALRLRPRRLQADERAASATSQATASSSRSQTCSARRSGPADHAYRSGGDEFAVILPGRRPDRWRGAVRAAPGDASAPTAGSPAPGLSLSAGIAELKPDDDGVSLFERAERALQRAKADGKGTAA